MQPTKIRRAGEDGSAARLVRRGWLASGVGALLTLCSAGLTSANGTNRAEFAALPLVSLAVTDAPVSAVLQKMSQLAHCDIQAADPWLASFPVTLRLTNASMEAALAKLLGNLNYELEVGRQAGNVTAITIHAKLPAPGQPPPGEPQVERRAARPSPHGHADLDVEVLPPAQPGGKGVTQRQVLAAQQRAASNTVAAAPGRQVPLE